MTQKEFAARANFNEAFASRVEQGRQNLTLTAIGRVALALGIPLTVIFEGIEPDEGDLDAALRRNARPRVASAEAPSAPKSTGARARRSVER